jgi:PAS domain S-box-containing protein
MKFKNIVPTQVERILADNEFIISKTDTKGKITYGNRPFNDYSGFSENELLGVQHNIVRHPDMPRAVFKLLWDEVQTGREVFAFVKNLSKDGSFYWVFANVTPSFDMKKTSWVTSLCAENPSAVHYPKLRISIKKC